MVKGDRDVTQAHINQMPYLKAFVRETFRVWPNGTEVSRYTEKDMVSCGFSFILTPLYELLMIVNCALLFHYRTLLGCVKPAFSPPS